jgi:hypothetical protein
MDVRHCVENNLSLSLVRKLHKSQSIDSELLVLESEGLIKLVRREKIDYRILCNHFEENELYRRFIDSRSVDRSTVSNDMIKYFQENNCGILSVSEDKVFCKNLFRPNAQENKLKSNLRISDNNILNQLRVRGKIQFFCIRNNIRLCAHWYNKEETK